MDNALYLQRTFHEHAANTARCKHTRCKQRMFVPVAPDDISFGVFWGHSGNIPLALPV